MVVANSCPLVCRHNTECLFLAGCLQARRTGGLLLPGLAAAVLGEAGLGRQRRQAVSCQLAEVVAEVLVACCRRIKTDFFRRAGLRTVAQLVAHADGLCVCPRAHALAVLWRCRIRWQQPGQQVGAPRMPAAACCPRQGHVLGETSPGRVPTSPCLPPACPPRSWQDAGKFLVGFSAVAAVSVAATRPALPPPALDGTPICSPAALSQSAACRWLSPPSCTMHRWVPRLAPLTRCCFPCSPAPPAHSLLP